MAHKNKNLGKLSDTDDWFAPVIAVSGSVSKCLNSVLSDLDAKSKFVQNLKAKIGDVSEGGLDHLTSLNQSIKILESTLRFRISLLQPDRKGSWFRSSVASTGPFSAAILHDPVFENYPDEKVSEIKQKLLSCWAQGNLVQFPFKSKTIWGILLTYRTNLADINRIESGPDGLTIENCLEKIPEVLESRYLRAFLMNVRAEYFLTKEKLDDCYAKLLSLSEKFWETQLEEKKKSIKQQAKEYENPAKKIREDFRKRREQPRTVIRTTADLEALRFMGFDNYPDMDELKRKYIHLAKAMHPDRNGGEDSDFKTLTKSYEHLLGRL